MENFKIVHNVGQSSQFETNVAEDHRKIEKQKDKSNQRKDKRKKEEPVDKQTLRNEVNDGFIQNTALELTEGIIDTTLNKGDFFVTRQTLDESTFDPVNFGKFHHHFVFVAARSVCE